MNSAELKLTKHAKERICERFHVKEGGEQAFFEKHFANAEKLASAPGDNNAIREYFVVKNIVFVIIPDGGLVVTVENKSSGVVAKGKADFKSRIQAFIKAEIERFTSMGQHNEALVLTLKTDIIGELADRYDELGRARSLPKKLALKGRIAALEERLNEVPTDMKHVRDEVRRKINGALAHY